MDRSGLIKKLRAAKGDLERLGIRHLALFGSVARGDATGASDIDVLVRFAPDTEISLLDVVHLENELSDLLGTAVQVVREPVKHGPLRARVEAERVNVF